MVKIFDRDGRGAGPLGAMECAALAALFLLAMALRLVPTILHPSLDHPDELFQSLEQAHRLVFGYGEIPWEFHLGARSWLLPGALAGFMWLGDRVADTPALYLGAAHLALAALAATSMLCAFFWGRRWFGSWGGLVAASLPALWPDAVYFGARSLSECVAAPLLVAALYLLDDEVKRPTNGRRCAGGLLLGFSAVLRLQLAPVLALALVWRLVEDWRRRMSLKAEFPFLIGIALALGAAGLIDAVTWRYPFQSLWLNFTYNAFNGAADSFGTAPWSYYLTGLIAQWRWSFPALVLLALLGGWRLKLPLAAAIVILIAHSLVPHKEYRFIYPAILLILILAGLGLAQLMSWFAARA
ncbi:MAG TPA: glycosyltransferase family 39 protein, partial [Stellaceae bacterium]|nr:glycosyltransferase family 39 protein [Stellaceae bacterium]